MKKTNFDNYLAGQMKDPVFSEHYARAGQAWDVALQIVALRKQAGLSQKDLAKVLKTSQQQVSRLESASYEGHSLNMLRRVADALHARVRIVFEPEEKPDLVAFRKLTAVSRKYAREAGLKKADIASAVTKVRARGRSSKPASSRD
jgi:transcriptional regulator with XRE-family HTH domain